MTCAPVNRLLVTYSLLVRAASRVAYGPSSKMCSFKGICRLRKFFLCVRVWQGLEMSGAYWCCCCCASRRMQAKSVEWIRSVSKCRQVKDKS